MRIDRRDDSDKDPLIRLQVLAYDVQDLRAVAFAGKRDIEMSRLQLEQARQQLCVIDICAMRGIEIASRAGMDADPLALLRREPRQHQIVELDEAVEEMARGRSEERRVGKECRH